MTNPMRPVIDKVEAQWLTRAKAQFLNPKTQAYKKAEVEFFMGAMAALQAMDPDAPEGQMTTSIPPIWVINIMSGRNVVEVPK